MNKEQSTPLSPQAAFEASHVKFVTITALVVAGLMGYTVGAITDGKKGFGWNLFAMLAALVIKLAGYYIAEGFIYGNWVAPLASIPGNVVQVVTAILIVSIVIMPLKKAAGKILFE